jgi:hypothetical protein
MQGRTFAGTLHQYLIPPDSTPSTLGLGQPPRMPDYGCSHIVHIFCCPSHSHCVKVRRKPGNSGAWIMTGLNAARFLDLSSALGLLSTFVFPHRFSSSSMMLHVGSQGCNDTTFTNVTDICMSKLHVASHSPPVGLATNLAAYETFIDLFIVAEWQAAKHICRAFGGTGACAGCWAIYSHPHCYDVLVRDWDVDCVMCCDDVRFVG